MLQKEEKRILKCATVGLKKPESFRMTSKYRQTMNTCLSMSLSVQLGSRSTLAGTDFREAHGGTIKGNVLTVQIVRAVLLMVVVIAVLIVITLVVVVVNSGLVIGILRVAGSGDAANGRRRQAL